MSGPDLIAEYLRDLADRLPADIVEELADGLDRTRRRLVDQGLDRSAACAAAIVEFGRPEQIARAFAEQSPARRTARTLLAMGPVVGCCWAAVLLTGRAWTWPVPAPARFGVGAVLLAVIGTLLLAAFSGHYRRARIVAAIGFAGTAGLDITLLAAAAVVAPAPGWALMLAVPASLARLAFTASALHPAASG